MNRSNSDELLKNMDPELIEGKYYIASVNESQLMAIANYLNNIICIYRENEGLTVVFSESVKGHISGLTNKEIVGPFAMITLGVYSDLMSIGFLAKITGALADEKISVNAFSAYHHDHLLVPYNEKDSAMAALKRLQKR
jgi:hypothetical protein